MKKKRFSKSTPFTPITPKQQKFLKKFKGIEMKKNYFIKARVFQYNGHGKPEKLVHCGSGSDLSENVELSSPAIHKFVKNGREYVANVLFASPMALYQNKIVTIDIDIAKTVIAKKYPSLLNYIDMLEQQATHSISAKEHITFYLKVDEETLNFIDNCKALQNATLDKTDKSHEHIEILHKSNHALVYGLSHATVNDQDNYYKLYNYQNLETLADCNLIRKFLNEVLELSNSQKEDKTPLENPSKPQKNNKSSNQIEKKDVFKRFHTFLKKKSDDYVELTTEQAIGLATQDPAMFYSYLLEFDASTYQIGKGTASNAFTNIAPFFYGRYTDVNYYWNFVDFVENFVYNNIDSPQEHNYTQKMGRKAVEIPEQNKILWYGALYNENSYTIIHNDKFKTKQRFTSKQMLKDTLKANGITYDDSKDAESLIFICDDTPKRFGTFSSEPTLAEKYRIGIDKVFFYNEMVDKREGQLLWRDYCIDNDCFNEWLDLRAKNEMAYLLLQNIFGSSLYEENILIQASHFVKRIKQQFCTFAFDKGGSGKDMYFEKIKSLMYQEQYFKWNNATSGLEFFPEGAKYANLWYIPEFRITNSADYANWKDLLTSKSKRINQKYKDHYEKDFAHTMFEYSSNSIEFLAEYGLEPSLQRRLNIVASSGKDLDSVLRNAKNYNPKFYFSDEVQLSVAKDIARHFYATINQYDDSELLQKLAEAREKILAHTKQVIENCMLTDEEAFCSMLTKALVGKNKNEVLELLSKIDSCQYFSLPLRQYVAEEEWSKIKWRDLKTALDTIDRGFVSKNKHLYYEVTGKTMGSKKDGSASIKYTA